MRDPNKTKQFQDWVNGVYPGAIPGATKPGGVGKFGPQTTAAWRKYGKTYESISGALTRPAGTVPGQGVSTAKVPGTPAATNTSGEMFTTGPQLSGTMTNADPTGQYNWRRDDANVTPPTGIRVPRTPVDIVGTVNKAANAIAPFASNIVNAFRKPPMPKRGMNDSYTALQKVDLSNERNAVSNTIAASNRATERNVDSNTAEAVKAFNRGEEFSRLSAINERETNTNIGISNAQGQMDAAVSAANVTKENKYRDELVARDVAHQREQSANWANAGDKLMMIRNEKSKERTELAKANVLAKGLYGQSGVLDRARRRMQQSGEPDPLGKDYKDLMADGGTMKKIPKRKLY